MDCPSCGRVLAKNAKCVYCGQGTQFKRREELQIPEGTLPERRRSSVPWGGIVVVLVVGGLIAACYLHPGIHAIIRSLFPF